MEVARERKRAKGKFQEGERGQASVMELWAEKENGREDGTKELIIVLKELKNELKHEIAELRKEIRKMKEE